MLKNTSLIQKRTLLSYLPAYVRKDLFQVIFHVTYRCNARCSFCLNAANLNKEPSSALTLAEIEKIARGMPSFPWLLLSGGEPFLRDDLSDIVSLFYRFNDVRLLSLPTNGILPDKAETIAKKILADCPGLMVNLEVSLDGTGHNHDRIRGVNQAFEKVLETVSRFQGISRQNARTSVKIETVVSKENYKYLEEIKAFVGSLSPDRHILDLARGDLADPLKYLPEPEEIEKIYPQLQETLEGNSQGKPSLLGQPLQRLYRGISRAYWEVTERTIKENRRIIPCYAGRISAVIYPNGDLAFCELLPPVGNLRKEAFHFSALWNAETAQLARKRIKRKECSCFHPCNQLINILFNPFQAVKALTY